MSRHPVITGVAGPEKAFARPYLDRLGDDRGLKTYYRPLPLLSFSLGRKLWGMSPGAERLVNLFLFFFWLWLVYGVVYRKEKNRWMAGTVMLLCACYPLNWDNVSWVAGRPDMLMLVFGTAALLLLEGDGRFYRRAQYGSVLFFALALLSKETAFFFLPLLILPMGRHREPGWMTRGLFVLLSVAALVTRHAATGFWGVPGMGQLSLFHDATRLLGALGVYARSLIFPFGVSPYLPPEWVPGTLDLFLGVGLAGIMVWLVYRWFFFREERLPLSLLLVFMGGHLLAVFSALSLSVAPRFMTIPFLGAVWWGLKRAGKCPEISRPVAIALVVTFLPFVPLQASAYRDNRTYWEDIHRAYPESIHFSLQLAREYITSGRFLDGERQIRNLKPERDRDRGDRELLQANIDLARADYPALVRRLHRIETMVPDPAAAAAVLRLRARMVLLSGDEESAISMMNELVERDPRVEWVRELHRMLLGRCRWGQAEALERSFYGRGIVFSPSAETIRRSFPEMTEKHRLEYYVRHWNPGGALVILDAMPKRFSNELLRAGMNYFSGEPEAARSLLEALGRTPGGRKKIGIWYLGRMSRPREALQWLRQSLDRDPEQPDVLRLIEVLEPWQTAGKAKGGER